MMEPPVEDLLDRVDSKFTLVSLAAMRGRQINSYFNQLGEGLGTIVPPQVTSVSRKPLSISLEEIAAGKITYARTDAEPEGEEGEEGEEAALVDGPAEPGAQPGGAGTQSGGTEEIEADAVAGGAAGARGPEAESGGTEEAGAVVVAADDRDDLPVDDADEPVEPEEGATLVLAAPVVELDPEAGAGWAPDAASGPSPVAGTTAWQRPSAPDLDGPDLDGSGLDAPDLDGPDLDGPDLHGPDLDAEPSAGYGSAAAVAAEPGPELEPGPPAAGDPFGQPAPTAGLHVQPAEPDGPDEPDIPDGSVRAAEVADGEDFEAAVPPTGEPVSDAPEAEVDQ
jgi:DNA-directed RNA polymerase subunit omega